MHIIPFTVSTQLNNNRLCRTSTPNALNQQDNKKQKECENKYEILSIDCEEDDEELETVMHDVFKDMTEKNKIGVKNRKLNGVNKWWWKSKKQSSTNNTIN